MVGLGTALLLWIYDRVVMPSEATAKLDRRFTLPPVTALKGPFFHQFSPKTKAFFLDKIANKW